MKKVLGKTAMFLLLAAAFNLLTVLALPHLVNAFVMHRILKLAVNEATQPQNYASEQGPVADARRAAIRASGGYNVALPSHRADASARTVVRPSPDLLYTVCVFDLRRGALHITGPVPTSYVSVSGFAADTSNFFALNDSTAVAGSDGVRRFDLLLTRSGSAPANAPPGARRITSPSPRGIVLFRTLITDDAALPALRSQVQGQQLCTLIPG